MTDDLTETVRETIEHHTGGQQGESVAETSVRTTLSEHAGHNLADVVAALDDLEERGEIEREDGRIRLAD